MHPAAQGGKWCRRDKRLAIYLRDGFACAYCGRDLRSMAPRDVTLDHLIPVSEGGNNAPLNLVTSCRSCNCSRGARPWREFAPGGAQERIEELVVRPLNRELAKAIISGTAGDPRVEMARG